MHIAGQSFFLLFQAMEHHLSKILGMFVNIIHQNVIYGHIQPRKGQFFIFF